MIISWIPISIPRPWQTPMLTPWWSWARPLPPTRSSTLALSPPLSGSTTSSRSCSDTGSRLLRRRRTRCIARWAAPSSSAPAWMQSWAARICLKLLIEITGKAAGPPPSEIELTGSFDGLLVGEEWKPCLSDWTLVFTVMDKKEWGLEHIIFRFYISFKKNKNQEETCHLHCIQLNAHEDVAPGEKHECKEVGIVFLFWSFQNDVHFFFVFFLFGMLCLTLKLTCPSYFLFLRSKKLRVRFALTIWGECESQYKPGPTCLNHMESIGSLPPEQRGWWELLFLSWMSV